MGFSSAHMKDNKLVGGWARIWKVEDKGNYSVAQLSTSKKDESGNYETDFQDGYVRLVGRAHNLISGVDGIENMKRGVGIQILNCDVSNKYDAQTKKRYTNYVIFDFDFTDNVNLSANKSNMSLDDMLSIPDTSYDELPFV